MLLLVTLTEWINRVYIYLDTFWAWKPSLCHRETERMKNYVFELCPPLWLVRILGRYGAGPGVEQDGGTGSLRLAIQGDHRHSGGSVNSLSCHSALSPQQTFQESSGSGAASGASVLSSSSLWWSRDLPAGKETRGRRQVDVPVNYWDCDSQS